MFDRRYDPHRRPPAARDALHKAWTALRRSAAPLLFLLPGFGAFAQTECGYGQGQYAPGAILCQAGTTMQCQRDVEGRVSWISLGQACGAPPPAAATVPAAQDTGAAAPPTGAPTAIVAERDLLIRILWAHYGRDGQNCDAQPVLGERCGGSAACEIEVGPEALCGDPFPAHSKLLTVYWQCANTTESRLQAPAYGADGTQLTLRCRR